MDRRIRQPVIVQREQQCKVLCSCCERIAFMLTEQGIDVIHTHNGAKHKTILPMSEIISFLSAQNYVIFHKSEVAAQLAA